MTWTLQVDEARTEAVTSEAHLRRRLQELQALAKAEPMFAVLNAPDGSSLCIGLGRDVSVLSHADPGGWPSRTSLGDNADADAVVDYSFLGHYTEIPVQYLIPLERAIEATVEFFLSGRASEAIQWEDD